MSFVKCKEITSLMSGFDKPWFFVGGWAIDLFIGKETRHHQDIEIGIFRNHQKELKDYLKDWDFKKVSSGEFSPWEDEFLERPIHEIHGLNKSNGNLIEILLNEANGSFWRYRRDQSITYPIKSVLRHTNANIPYLNPEIVLLYKAKNTREKDQLDFMEIKNYLNDQEKKWLRTAINSQDPNHDWLKLLT